MNELTVPTSEEIEESPLNIHEEVEKRLREAQASKTFKDSDIRIGGSRKEQAALRKILRFGLGDLNEAEKSLGEVATIQFVKKDKVFPVFSAKQQLDQGVTSGAAFLKMKMREAYPSKPSVINAASRRLYVGYANMLFDEFLPIPNVELFLKKQDEVAARLPYDIIRFVLDADWEKELVAIMNAYGNDFIMGAYGGVTEAAVDFKNPDYNLAEKKLVPFRTEFVDFDDAYAYQAKYFNRLQAAYYKAADFADEELKKYGINRWALHFTDLREKMLLSGSFTEETREAVLDSIRQSGRVDEEHVEKVYNLEKLFLHCRDLHNKLRNMPGSSPYYALAMGMVETKLVEQWYFYKEFFSARFNNFMRNLNQKGMPVYESAYLPAIEVYQGITEAQSVEDIKQNTERAMTSLQGARDEYIRATDAKFVEEMDALYKADKVSHFGFYMNHYTKSKSRYVLSHATFDELFDKDDKYIWWNKLIQALDERVKYWENDIAKFNEKHQPRPDSWSWAADELGADVETTVETAEGEKIVSKGRKKTLHDKKILEFIERTGGLLIDKSRLTDVEAIKAYLRDTFGFKAFEYGASLPDVEAKEIIYHFLGAMSDFGEILNIDIAGLNRRCGLSMGFGSRGRGRAKASYFPLARIINLTRSNGDGSVAHELGHYLDNMVSFLDNPGRYVYLDFATQNQIPTETLDRTLRKKTQSKHELDSIEVKQAFWQIMSYIMYGYKMTVLNGSVSYRPDEGVVGYVEYVATAENAGNARLTSSFTMPKFEDLSIVVKYLATRGMGRFETLSKSQLKVYDIIVRDAGLKEYTFRIPSKMSRYYSESKQVGGAYWIEKPELFARAFEVYVYDKLKKRDRYNNFLVDGDYQDDAIDFLAEYPYPQHEERQYLFGLFDNLILAMKQAYGIGDFVPFTSDRNEYTKVTLDISELPQQKAERLLEKKLKELLLLIATPQLKAGGSLTSNKARKILREGTAHGYPLTDKQKRFFGWIIGRKKAEGGPPLGPGAGEERINWAEMLSGLMVTTTNGKKTIAGQECELEEEGFDSLIMYFVDESALKITVTKQPGDKVSIKLNVGVPDEQGNGEPAWIANDVFEQISSRLQELGMRFKNVDKKASGGGVEALSAHMKWMQGLSVSELNNKISELRSIEKSKQQEFKEKEAEKIKYRAELKGQGYNNFEINSKVSQMVRDQEFINSEEHKAQKERIRLEELRDRAVLINDVDGSKKVINHAIAYLNDWNRNNPDVPGKQRPTTPDAYHQNEARLRKYLGAFVYDYQKDHRPNIYFLMSLYERYGLDFLMQNEVTNINKLQEAEWEYVQSMAKKYENEWREKHPKPEVMGYDVQMEFSDKARADAKGNMPKLMAEAGIRIEQAPAKEVDARMDLFQHAVNKLKEGDVLDTLFWKIYDAFVHEQLDSQLEDWLQEYYENPGYEAHIEKITADLEKEADNITHEYKVNYMLESLGLSILATYEKMDATTDEKEIDRLHEDVLLLQAAINFIIQHRDTIGVEGDADTPPRYLWQMTSTGRIVEPLTVALKEIFTELLKKTKQQEYLKRLQEHVAHAVPHMQLDWFAIRHIEDGYDSWVKAKARGFDKVQIDKGGTSDTPFLQVHGGTGWGDYHSKEILEDKIVVKPLSAEIRMCEWPNGKFSYGVDFNYSTGGHGYGCGGVTGSLYDTQNAAIKDFYKEMTGFFDNRGQDSEKVPVKAKDALFKKFKEKYAGALEN